MEIILKEHFVRITPEDGFITTFKEGDDILTFDASIMVYAPLTADLSAYRERSVLRRRTGCRQRKKLQNRLKNQ